MILKCPSSTKLDGVPWSVSMVFIIVVTCCVGMHIGVQVWYTEGAYSYYLCLEIYDSLCCMHKAFGYFNVVSAIYVWLVGMQGSWNQLTSYHEHRHRANIQNVNNYCYRSTMVAHHKLK